MISSRVKSKKATPTPTPATISIYHLDRDGASVLTNVTKHIKRVKDSNCLKEIRALKIWQMQQGLDFPSLYLEEFTIQSLSNRPPSSPLSENILHVLRAIASDLKDREIADPANPENILSSDLLLYQKQKIATKAGQAASENNWSNILRHP